MSKQDRWKLGDGTYVLNEQANMETILGGMVDWLAHAQELNELLAKRLSADNYDHVQTIRTLSVMSLLNQMSLDCARRARVQAVFLEPPDATYP